MSKELREFLNSDCFSKEQTTAIREANEEAEDGFQWPEVI